MNKLIKIFQVILGLISVIAILMIVAFVVMFVKLAQYKECQDTGFQPTYCEKYKNF